MGKEQNGTPPAVIQRFPIYLARIRELTQTVEGAPSYISSLELADALGLTASTVRQDFSHLELSDSDKRGYGIRNLESELVRSLGVETEKKLLIVGAGNLGRALAQHGNFAKYGFQVRGIIDSDSSIIGEQVGDCIVRDISDLDDVIAEERIDIGVIAVPDSAAQAVADLLIHAGVRGLLNLAFTRIVVPEDVHVIDGRIVSSLMVLSGLMSA